MLYSEEEGVEEKMDHVICVGIHRVCIIGIISRESFITEDDRSILE